MIVKETNKGKIFINTSVYVIYFKTRLQNRRKQEKDKGCARAKCNGPLDAMGL